jgi:hypothetical protein
MWSVSSRSSGSSSIGCGSSASYTRQARSMLRRSVRTMSSMSGYCTFTATASPLRSRAACTCASEADAIGASANSANSASRGLPSSRSTAARTTANGFAGTASWHFFSSSTNSGGNTSARVAIAWHILMITPRIESAQSRIQPAAIAWRRCSVAASGTPWPRNFPQYSGSL